MNKLRLIVVIFSLLAVGFSSFAQDNSTSPTFNDNSTVFEDPDLDLKNQIELLSADLL